jgi:transposase-like protein
VPADPLLTRVRRATARRSRSDTEWRAAICAARDAGLSYRVIAEAAGVSHVRVIQLLRE